MKKIVLYNPNTVFYTMPLGLLAVASGLDRSRFDVKIIDGRLERDPVGAVLAEIDDALCLGVTVLTGAPLGDALRVLRAAKRKRPDLVTVCGGWHPSLFATEMLEEPVIDITVQGQGEATFPELIDCLADGGDLSDIGGIAFRDIEDTRRNPPRPLAEMDDFPPPDYTLIPVESYFRLKGQRQLDYVSSTGCHFRCAFCADPFVHGQQWKAVSPARMGAEIDRLWRAYRFTDLNFQDETFFTYRTRSAAIAEEFLSGGRGFTWAATMRADQGVRMGDDLFAHCVRSGLRRVLIGVESGSPRMLKRIRKDTTVEQILSSAEMCARHGIGVIFSFIVGFPGESDDQVMETVALVKRLSAMSPKFETPIFYYKPYPGSRLAVGNEDDVPRDLDGWAGFDYVAGKAGPWVSPGIYRLIERFKFYNEFAYGRGRAWRRSIRWLAHWRCSQNNFAFPLEKLVIDRIRPRVKLS